MFQLVNEHRPGATIKVIGIGGAGGNAVNTMVQSGLDMVDFIAANTDQQALGTNLAPIKIQLGESLTKGLGAGANPEIGKKAALEDADRIKDVLEGADMVFITAGLGGGTGTGGAPVVARISKEMGILTVAVVTRPFTFEGTTRRRQAEEGLRELRDVVDSLVVIPNDKLFYLGDGRLTMEETLKKADEVLCQAVRGITDLITKPGYINLDFADVRTIMTDSGIALMGTGSASGEGRAAVAADKAISNPLLEDYSIKGARRILFNITGGKDLTLMEVNEAAEIIQREADPDANVIFGTVIDEEMEEEVTVTVIATDFTRPREEVVPVAQKKRVYPVDASKAALEKPTFERVKERERFERKPEPSFFEEEEIEDFEELDIPAFLRRRGE